MFRVVTVVQQMMTEFNGAVPEKKIMTITKIVLKLMNQNGCWISKVLHLMRMGLRGSAMSSVHRCKTYAQMWTYSQRHIWKPMRGSLFEITIFIEPTATRAEEAELPLH
jgi:hypothetical protein